MKMKQDQQPYGLLGTLLQQGGHIEFPDNSGTDNC